MLKKYTNKDYYKYCSREAETSRLDSDIINSQTVSYLGNCLEIHTAWNYIEYYLNDSSMVPTRCSRRFFAKFKYFNIVFSASCSDGGETSVFLIIVANAITTLAAHTLVYSEWC